jgi:hypothetical protein
MNPATAGTSIELCVMFSMSVQTSGIACEYYYFYLTGDPGSISISAYFCFQLLLLTSAISITTVPILQKSLQCVNSKFLVFTN